MAHKFLDDCSDAKRVVERASRCGRWPGSGNCQEGTDRSDAFME